MGDINVKMDFGNSIRNFENLTKNTSSNVKQKISLILKQEVNRVYFELRRNWGREYKTRSGNLQKSWKFRRLNTRTWEITNSMNYADFIEEGTNPPKRRGIRPRLMLQHAIDRARKRIKKRLEILDAEIARNFNNA